MKSYYYDTFRGLIVTEKEINAPPERYFAIGASAMDNSYVDYYVVGDNKQLCFAYTREESWKTDYELWFRTLECVFEKNGCDLGKARLQKRLYPPQEFRKMVKGIK